MEIDPDALHLRFRDDATPPEAPPDVSAFLRTSTAEGPPEGPEDTLGVIPGARPAAASAPLAVFFQHPDFGIPAPGYDHRVPDLTSWSVRATTFGWVASVQPNLRGPGPRRAYQVLAGCIALALPAHALAQAPASTPPPVLPPIQAPKSQPTTAPAPAPTEATPAPAPVQATPPAATPAPQAPAPVSSAVADAAWEGVDGFDVIVELKGGKIIRGRVGAVQAETFTLIDGADGQILVIPKSGVASLRAYIPPPIPTKTGTGLLAGGGVLTALGAPVFITGVTFLALCPSCTYLHLPMLLVGGAALGGGIPMIARGAQQRNAFQRALQERRLTPMLTRTPYGGWSGGLQLRF